MANSGKNNYDSRNVPLWAREYIQTATDSSNEWIAVRHAKYIEIATFQNVWTDCPLNEISPSELKAAGNL